MINYEISNKSIKSNISYNQLNFELKKKLLVCSASTEDESMPHKSLD